MDPPQSAQIPNIINQEAFPQPIEAPQPINPQEPTKNKNSSIIFILSFTTIIACLIAAFFYWQNTKLIKEVTKIETTSVPTSTPDKTIDWKTYNFSPTISYKLPQGIKEPLFVNTGHYAQETILPGNTTFQIWGADGASPSGGKDYYNNLKQDITSNSTFQTKALQLDNLEGLEFTTSTPSLKLVMGGEVYLKLRGILVKTGDGRGLVIIHYIGQTLQKNGDFNSDELIFEQILPTFKFSNLTKTQECIAQTTCKGTQPCISNPASVFCTCMGGKSTIKKAIDGSESGVCTIDGKTSDEWEYYRGLNPTAINYTCPPNGYVDCMPVLDSSKQIACSSEALAWYKANCPDYKGVAQ